jgi:8-oxo-dGTP pyrophosphatase MutT (NUDIX family)
MIETQSAGGVVLNTRGEVVVVSQQGNSWSLPKGHIDAGEDALAAAKREIAEEAGLTKLVLVRSLGTYQRFRGTPSGGDDTGELKTIHMFLFTTDEEHLAPQDPHNPEARWVETRDVAELLTHPKDKAFFKKLEL